MVYGSLTADASWGQSILGSYRAWHLQATALEEYGALGPHSLGRNRKEADGGADG